MITDPGVRALQQGFSRLFKDPRLKKSITLHVQGVTTWNDTLGRNETAYVETVVPAIELKHTKQSVSEAHSPDIQVGDRVFVVMWKDFSGEINIQDMVQFEGQDFDVKDVDARLQIARLITVRGS